MIDKFAGLEGKVRKELERIQNSVLAANEQWAKKVGQMDAYEQVLKWIKELNEMEILENKRMSDIYR
jgi:hypothetical protein